MNESVINCPSEFHKKPRTHRRQDGSYKEISATPRTLITFKKGTVGTISAQCKDAPCCTDTKRQTNREYNGWYSIEINELGSYKITPIPVPEKRWELDVVPVVVMEGK